MTFLEFILVLLMAMGFFIFLALWVKIGKEARFLVLENLFRGGGAILLAMKPSGQTVLKHVSSKGMSLIHGKTGFSFLPTVVSNPNNSEIKLNELIERKAWFSGKPFFTGSIQTSLASTPFLAEAIDSARDLDLDSIVKFLEELNKVNLKHKFMKSFDLIYPWDINALEEYVNVVFTDQDIDEAYKEGYIKGLSSYDKYSKLLLILVIILLASLLATIFFLV